MPTKPVATTPAPAPPAVDPSAPASQAPALSGEGTESAASTLDQAPDTDTEPAAEVATTLEPDDEPQQAEEIEPSPLDELPESPDVPAAELEREKEIVTEAFPGFDIPMIVNDRVLGYVDYFSGRHKSFFEMSLARSGRYLETFQRTFEQAGIPTDLVYMAHVESAFKTSAYSRAKAKGIFQFIAGTGRRYGLRIDSWVDERSDPDKSARAAAAYLKDLYGMFGDWYLALAAYNAGEGKIQRSIVKTGKRDFWSLASTKSLRRETRDYVPAILAATLIAKQPGKYGFDVTLEKPIASDIVAIEGQTDLRVLARLADVDPEIMRQLNPQLRRGATPPGAVTEVRVPAGLGNTMADAYAALPASERMVLARHEVAQGESLAAIAHKYGVSSTALARANGLSTKSTLHAGQDLTVPAVLAAAGRDDGAALRGGRYRVQRGDTLSGIARRYRTSVTRIAAANGISPSAHLRVGQRLTIPGRGTSVVASSRTGGASTGRAAATKTAAASKGPAVTSAKPVVHTVRRGETLYRIAGRYKITVDMICALNNITPNGVLYPGTRLTIRAN